ncbi:MAG: LmeA family phospholipid-binding protein [Fimbriimonadaceae bacterium]|nr:LmeA family phospholipid-binding protein [Fimbriimonadaceae bacterium]
MSEPISLQRFHAVAEQLKLPMGLVVDELTIDTGSANAETDPFSLKLESPGAVVVRIGETNVRNYLETLKPGGLRDFSVSCREGMIFVKATARILLDVPVTAQCKLVIDDGERLNVELVEAQVVGGDAKRLVEGQINRVNPIFNVADMPIALILDSVAVNDGFVILHGRATL